MRLLFTMDQKDYEGCTQTFARHSARAIIRSGDRLAMVHSLKYDYYKFPGGGIEAGEDPVEAMIRETREEAGLVVRRDTVTEYGYVHRVQRSNRERNTRFVQDNFYYLVRVEAAGVRTCLDPYEADEGFTLEYVSPETAIRANRGAEVAPFEQVMLQREARVIEMLMEEGYLEPETPVRLEPMTAQMYHAYFQEYQNDPDLYIDKAAWAPFVYDEAWVDAYIARQAALNRRVFAIMLGDEMAGELVIKNIRPGCSATLGIALRNASYKDRGIGTRAERLAIDYVFNRLDIPVLYADSIVSNTRSQHVLEKVGFRFVKEEGDFRYYQINRPTPEERDRT